MLATIGHVLRLGRAGFILAREGVFSGIDAASLPPEARPALWLARLVARRDGGVERIAPAIARLGPSYVKLGQSLATRPDVVGAAVARELERLQDKMGPLSAHCRGGSDRKGFCAADRRSFCRVERAGRGGLDRSGPSRHGGRGRGRAAGRGESASSGNRAAVPSRSRRHVLRRAAGGKIFRRGAPAQSRRRGRHPGPLGQDRNGFPSRGRRGVRIRRKHPWRRRFSGSQGRLEPLRARGHDFSNGSRARLCPISTPCGVRT